MSYDDDTHRVDGSVQDFDSRDSDNSRPWRQAQPSSSVSCQQKRSLSIWTDWSEDWRVVGLGPHVSIDEPSLSTAGLCDTDDNVRVVSDLDKFIAWNDNVHACCTRKFVMTQNQRLSPHSVILVNIGETSACVWQEINKPTSSGMLSCAVFSSSAECQQVSKALLKSKETSVRDVGLIRVG